MPHRHPDRPRRSSTLLLSALLPVWLPEYCRGSLPEYLSVAEMEPGRFVAPARAQQAPRQHDVPSLLLGVEPRSRTASKISRSAVWLS